MVRRTRPGISRFRVRAAPRNDAFDAALPDRQPHCKGWRHRCVSLRRQLAAGPVAQWLEPAAHNGLVAGSSPAGPTNEISSLLSFIRPERDHRTRNRTRYVRFSFAHRITHGDLLDSIRQIVGMVVTIGVQQNLQRHSKITSCLPWVCAPLHQPRRRRVSQGVRGYPGA